MKRFFLTLFLVTMLVSTVLGYYDYRSNIAYGGLGAKSYTSTSYGFYTNPAGLGFNKSFDLALNYKNWWGVSELQQVILSGTYNYKNNGIGIQFGSFGNSDLYSETLLNISYGRNIYKWISLGASFEFLYVSIGDEFGANNTIGFDVGLVLKPAPELLIGITGKGINGMEMADDKLEPSLLTGIQIIPTRWYNLCLGVEKESGKKGHFKTSQEIIFKDIIHFRSGLTGDPTSFLLGLGISYKNAIFAISYINHPDLGGDTTFELTYTPF